MVADKLALLTVHLLVLLNLLLPPSFKVTSFGRIFALDSGSLLRVLPVSLIWATVTGLSASKKLGYPLKIYHKFYLYH